MPNNDPYSRLYWRFRDEFPDVYQDNDALATWLRLLLIAEGTHPSAADLPRKVKPSVLTKLVDEGLVTLFPGDRYRIKGLSGERERRSEAARTGGIASGRSRTPSTAVQPPFNGRSTDVQPLVNLDETRRDEQRRDETSTPRAGGFERVGAILPDVDEITPDVVKLQKLAEELTGQAYVMHNVHGGLGAKAVNEQLPHGFDRVQRAWRQIANRARAEGSNAPTLRQLVFGADDILNPIPDRREGEKAERVEEEERLRAKREQANAANLRYLRGESA